MLGRLVRLRAHMAREDIDAALFTSIHNINYFADFVYCSFGRSYGLVVTAEGSTTISANIDGEFAVRRRDQEYRLEVGDGTQHVHVEWSRVKRVELGDHDGEGMLTFFDGAERLFRLYRPAGPYPTNLNQFVGDLD